MSKIDELIAELCQDGVSFKKLNEISVMKRGTSITKKDTVEGDVPVISGGKMPAYYCDSYNVRRHIVGGANRTLISAITSL